MAFAQAAVKFFAKPVDYGGVALQKHVRLHAVRVNPGYPRAFFRHPRFLFHQRGHYKQIEQLVFGRAGVAPDVDAPLPEGVDHAGGHRAGLGRGKLFRRFFQKVCVRVQEPFGAIKRDAHFTQKVLVVNNGLEVFGFCKALALNLFCHFPPGQAFADGEPFKRGLAIHQLVKHFCGRPAGIELKHASLNHAGFAPQARENFEFLHAADSPCLVQAVGHIGKGVPGDDFKHDVAARLFRRGVHKSPGFEANAGNQHCAQDEDGFEDFAQVDFAGLLSGRIVKVHSGCASPGAGLKIAAI